MTNECANGCGCEAGTSYSVHMYGMGHGPEVRLCDACGSEEIPSLDSIWASINRQETEGRTDWPLVPK